MNQTQLTREELEPYRSKLYSLNSENGWVDQGTGFPQVSEGDGEAVLKFINEDTGNAIYQIGITIDLQFDFQDEKIFTWYNQQTNLDMALSFQNEAAAQALWDKIAYIIQKQNRNMLLSAFSNQDNRMEEPHLTLPTENNLLTFESELSSYATGKIDRKNTVCQILCQKREYLNHLIGVFKATEEKRDIDKLTLLFKIFRQMINLAHYELYQVLLSDEYYLEVFGALEYDPERMVGKTHPSHRSYFQNYASLKEIGQIKDPEVLKTIHWNIRLLYLRDCVLAHYLDERILQFLSAIVNSNYVEILNYIQHSREVLSAVFELLRQRKLNALKMIHEICLTMKNLDVDKVGIYQVFAEFNMFETLEEIMVNTSGAGALGLKKKDNKKKEATDEIDVKVHIYMILEILMLNLVQAPRFLRDYCISQHQTVLKYPLLTYIFNQTINHEDPIIQNMLGEVIKHLIDPSAYEEVQIQMLFYEKFLAKLLEIFDINSTEEKIKNAKSVVLDVLIYCSKQQMENLKKRIVPLDVSGKIFKNFSTNDKFLIITIIQLYKLLLQSKDAEIVSHLAKPLDVIIDYFLKNCKNKTNLLHSSLLEVFVLIMKEELLPLLTYIVENHKGFIKDEDCKYITEKIKDKQRRLSNGDSDKMYEEQKQNRHPFNLNNRRGRSNLTIISPFGSAVAVDNSDSSRRVGPISTMNLENSSPVNAVVASAGTEEKINSGNGSPGVVGSPPKSDQDLKRTSSNLAKIVDYDDEMEFNMETRGKDMNFLLEDIQLKKRKMDDLTAVNILNK